MKIKNVFFTLISLILIIFMFKGIYNYIADKYIFKKEFHRGEQGLSHLVDWNKKYIENITKTGVKYPKDISLFDSDSIYPQYKTKKNKMYKRLKNGKFIETDKEDEALVVTNNLGLNGSRKIGKKNKNEFRILCIGGSTTQGVRNYKTSWPYHLEILLNQKPSSFNFRVINAGFGGYRIKDSLFFIKEIAHLIDPDLIIYLGGHNDIVFRRHAYFLDKYKGDLWKRDLSEIEKLKVKAYLEDSNYDLLVKTLKTYPYKINKEKIDRDKVEFFNSIVEIKKIFNAKPFIVSSLVSLYLSEIEFKSLKKEILENYINLIYPMRINEMSGIYSNFNKALEEYIKKNQSLHFINMAKNYPYDKNHFFDSMHLNEKGNEIFAKIMAQKLIELNQLPIER